LVLSRSATQPLWIGSPEGEQRSHIDRSGEELPGRKGEAPLLTVGLLRGGVV
jgi:hypothetical protein